MVVVCLVGWVGGTLLAGRKSHLGKTWRQKVKCKANVQQCLQGLTGRVSLYPSDTDYLYLQFSLFTKVRFLRSFLIQPV